MVTRSRGSGEDLADDDVENGERGGGGDRTYRFADAVMALCVADAEIHRDEFVVDVEDDGVECSGGAMVQKMVAVAQLSRVGSLVDWVEIVAVRHERHLCCEYRWDEVAVVQLAQGRSFAGTSDEWEIQRMET